MKSGNIRRSNKDNTPNFWRKSTKKGELDITEELVPINGRVFNVVTITIPKSKKKKQK